MVAQIISEPPVWITSWVEALAVVSLGTVIAAFITGYRHIECHRTGCHRLGRFPHGHLRLCAAHHPKTPDDGKITAQHIKAVQP